MKKTRAEKELINLEQKLIEDVDKWLQDWDAVMKETPPQRDTHAVVSQNVKMHMLLGYRLENLGAGLIDFVRAYKEANKK